jgi:hypothetical protein
MNRKGFYIGDVVFYTKYVNNPYPSEGYSLIRRGQYGIVTDAYNYDEKHKMYLHYKIANESANLSTDSESRLIRKSKEDATIRQEMEALILSIHLITPLNVTLCFSEETGNYYLTIGE